MKFSDINQHVAIDMDWALKDYVEFDPLFDDNELSELKDLLDKLGMNKHQFRQALETNTLKYDFDIEGIGTRQYEAYSEVEKAVTTRTKLISTTNNKDLTLEELRALIREGLEKITKEEKSINEEKSISEPQKKQKLIGKIPDANARLLVKAAIDKSKGETEIKLKNITQGAQRYNLEELDDEEWQKELNKDVEWQRLCETVRKTYESFYYDNIGYTSGAKSNLPLPLHAHQKEVYGVHPKLIMQMLNEFLETRSHRITRHGQYEVVANAFVEWVKNHNDNEQLIDDMYQKLLEAYQTPDSASGFEQPVLPAKDKEDELIIMTKDGAAIPEQLMQDETPYVARVNKAVHDEYKERWQTLLTNESEFLEEVNRLLQLINTKEVSVSGSSKHFMNQWFSNDKGNFRRWNRLLDIFEKQPVSLNEATKKAFQNGGMGFLAALNTVIELKLAGRTGVQQDDVAVLKLATALECMKDAYLPKLEQEPQTPPKDAPIVAIVDQFPEGTADVEHLSGKAVPGTHGVMVAQLAKTMGRNQTTTKYYTSGTTHNDLKTVFNKLKENPDVKVVNFSAILNNVQEDKEDEVYGAFLELCERKQVVVSTGNDGFELTSNGECHLRDPDLQVAGIPFIAYFLQGFTGWAEKNSKSLDKLKLTICENYMMDENNPVERSNVLAGDHPLACHVVHVRADCIVNVHDHSIQSGTSYAAPLVAGAMAAAGDMDIFKQTLSNKIMTAESLAALAIGTKAEKAIEEPFQKDTGQVVTRSFLKAARDPSTTQLPSPLEANAEGVLTPALSTNDQAELRRAMNEIRQVVPESGQAKIVPPISG